MSRYIDVENAKPIVEKAYHAWNLAMAAADGQREINRCFKMQELCKAVIPVLEHIPTADVREVKRGKWVQRKNQNGEGVFTCPFCRQSTEFSIGSPATYGIKFCEFCGAEVEMDDGNES